MTVVSTVDMTRSPTASQYGISGDRLQTEQTYVVLSTAFDHGISGDRLQTEQTQTCAVWSHQVWVVLSHEVKGSTTCWASGLRTGSSMSVKT